VYLRDQLRKQYDNSSRIARIGGYVRRPGDDERFQLRIRWLTLFARDSPSCGFPRAML
jgi:hypothetical protein